MLLEKSITKGHNEGYPNRSISVHQLMKLQKLLLKKLTKK